jgi:hypothetical protein
VRDSELPRTSRTRVAETRTVFEFRKNQTDSKRVVQFLADLRYPFTFSQPYQPVTPRCVSAT